MKVLELITAVATELKAIGKDGVNSMQKFNYRRYEDLVDSLAPLLIKHKLVIYPVRKTVQTYAHNKADGKINYQSVVAVTYRFIAVEDAAYIDVEVAGEGMDSGDKATPKAFTMAWKTAMSQTFQIRFEDQADADSDSPNFGTAKSLESKMAGNHNHSNDLTPAQRKISNATLTKAANTDLDMGYSGYKQAIELFEDKFKAVGAKAVATEILAKKASLLEGRLHDATVRNFFRARGATFTKDGKDAQGIMVDDYQDFCELLRVIEDETARTEA